MAENILSLTGRKLSGLFFAGLTALILSAAVSAAEKTKISFLWWPDPGGGFEELIADFPKTDPNINVEMIKGPTSTDTRETMYVTGFLAGEAAYDLVLMDIIWVPKFSAQGWLIPLDDWFDLKEQEKFFPGDIKGSYYNGKIYRVPLQTDVGLMYYRRDLLAEKKLNPPQTWEELVKISRALQNPPDISGFVFQGKQYEGLVCNFLEILWSFGGEVFNEAGNLVLNSPPAAEALKFICDLVRTDKITPEGVTTYEEGEQLNIKKFFFYLSLAALTVFSLSPFFWLAVTSLKSSAEIYSLPITYFPLNVSWAAYKKIIFDSIFLRYVLNSLIVASLTTLQRKWESLLL
ncbi:MAG: extracellular solute-binding protein [Elusimicrobiota bacterium]